jgi:putative oxidoreductase
MRQAGLVLLPLLRFGLAALFVWTGLLKLQSPEAAQMAIFQYRLVSWEAAQLLATLIPMLELSAALGLLIPRLRLGGVVLCIGLLVVFCGALAAALARNLDISCGCFGTTEAHAPALRRLFEDVLLLGLCCMLWKDSALKYRAVSKSSAVTPPPNPLTLSDL